MRRPTVCDMDEGGGETVSFDESVDQGWRLFGDKVTASMSEPEPQGHLIATFFGDSADQLMAGISWSRSEGDLIASVQLLPRDASLTEEQERALQGIGLGPTDAEGERHVVMYGDDPVRGAALVEFTATFGFGRVAANVGPSIGHGPVEAFNLSVGLWSIRTGAFVLDAALSAGVSP